jgi:hypothetical protein
MSDLGFSYKDEVGEIIDGLELSSKTDNSILKSRFLSEVMRYEERKTHTKKYYNIFRFVVTTGSILLPAVMSLGQMDPAKLPNGFDDASYWVAWALSLSVTASNGFLQLFSLDKNYFEYAITTEQLKTEGWQYFQLSGKYDDYESHKEAYRPFCKSVENIKRKQVEKEFSGKGEVKSKKEFNFKKELSNTLPSKYEHNTNTPVEEKLNNDSILSLLKGLSEVKEVKDSLPTIGVTDTKEVSVKGSIKETIKDTETDVSTTKSIEK